MTAPTVYDGLRLYFKFDDLSGPLTDSSGRNNLGTMTNASTVVGGKFGQALRMSTAAGNVSVPHDVSIAPLKQGSTDGPLSISIWVNLDKSYATMWGAPTFASKLSGNSGYFFGCLSAATNVISFRIFNLAGTAYTATYTEAATSGWVHYVAVYNVATVQIFRNGVSVASVAANGEALQNASALTIGTGFEGLLDELSIWSRSLSPAEVTALYASGAGLEIIRPIGVQTTEDVGAGQGLAEPFGVNATVPATLPSADSTAQINFTGASRVSSTEEFVSSTIPDPYIVMVLGKRLYMDPQPNIVAVEIDSDYHVTAIGNGGPTDATYVTTWWQIDLGPNQVFVMAARASTQGFLTNQNQTDHFDVPRGQNWQGMELSFWIQSTLDADQMWSSPPYVMLDDLWDHSGSNIPYPSIVDGMSLLLKAVNSWTTTLAADIDANTAIIPLESIDGLEITGGVVSIGTEVIHYRSVSTRGPNPVLMGVTRGYDGTTAAPHGATAVVEARIVAAHHNNSVDAIRAIEGAIGTTPAADPLTGGSFANLQDRLNATLPYLIEKPLTADWSFTHTRGRVVSTQFWLLQDDGSYAQCAVPTRQKIDVNGTSTVTVTFDSPQTGFIVVN